MKKSPELEAASKRIGTDLRKLMLIPGLSGHEGRVQRRNRGQPSGNRPFHPHGPAGQPDRDASRAMPDAPSVMFITHMDQLGLIVRKIEADGFVRVERLGGVPERALAAQPVLLCVGEGRDISGLIANKSHHATSPEEKYKVVPYQDIYIDTGLGSAEAVRAAGVDIGTPVVYMPNVVDLAGGRIAGTSVDDRAGCAVQIELARRFAKAPVAADGASRLFGAGGVQPSRRDDGGAMR